MLDGSYNLIIHAPIGRQELVCELKAEGAVLAGRVFKPGSSFDTAIYEGSVDGAKFRFKVDFPVKGMGSFTFTLSGEEADGKLAGLAKMALGKCKFEATRI